MPFVIEYAQEADIQCLLDIMYSAFHDDSLNRIMFPIIPAHNDRAASIARWRDELLDRHVSFLKVVDTEINEIIALAKWRVYLSERPESEWKGTPQRQLWDEGTNVEAANEFFSAIHEKRERIMGGRPHLCTQDGENDPENPD